MFRTQIDVCAFTQLSQAELNLTYYGLEDNLAPKCESNCDLIYELYTYIHQQSDL